MRKAIRITFGAAALGAVSVFLSPSTAQAQVRVEGRFRLPHGDISIGVGDPYYGRGYYGSPYYPVGSYVPYGHRVSRRPRLGFGFQSRAFACRPHGGAYHSHWVPVRRYRSRWVVVSAPVLVGERPYYEDGYSDDGGYDRGGRYSDRDYYGDSRRHACYESCPIHHPDARYGHVHGDSCGHDY